VASLMSEEEIERKIAVIFATDVVGYSKHMEADESSTIKNLRACEKILTALFEKHKGRLFNTGGDSFLAEFPSAVSAVECAVEFQNAIKTRNDSEHTTVKLEFRIGINSGDVVKEKENLLGDGVNIAARLEALAQTGGITLSKSVYDFVKGKTSHEFNDIGLQKVKQNEFHAYDLILDGLETRKELNSIKNNATRTVIFLMLIIFVITLTVFLQNSLFSSSNDAVNSEVKSNKPVILVKPFSSLGKDDDLVSKAITESLISNLSQYVGIKTLASGTAYAIEEENFSDADLIERFNVSFVISGTIQTFGSNSRLFVEVSELKNQQALLSINKDFNLEQIFEVQDSIGRKILETIQVEAVEGKKALDFQKDFKTYQQFILAINRDVEWRKWTKEGNSKAIEITKKLEELGADQSVIQNFKVWDLHQQVLLGYSANPEADKSIMLELSDDLVNNRGRDDDYLIRAIIELEHFGANCEYAIDLLNRIKNPSSSSDNFIVSGFIYSRCTNLEKAAASFRQSLELEPVDSSYQVTRLYSGVLYALGEYDMLKELLEPVISDPDLGGMPLWFYAAVLSEEGNKKEANQYFQLGVTYGADKKWIAPMLNNQEASDRLISNLSEFSNELDF